MTTDNDNVRLVCFDLGGVLVRIVRGWDEACTRAKIAVDPAGVAWDKHHELMIAYETGDIDEAGYLDAAGACVPGVTREGMGKIFDAWLYGMYPGAAELITELKRAGIVTACLSNTNERHWNTLRADPDYRPLQDLDHQFVSHHLRAMKPAEQAYRAVEQSTGFSGKRILFFDDKPENIEAARKVGWRAERIDRVEDAVSQIREFLAQHKTLNDEG